MNALLDDDVCYIMNALLDDDVCYIMNALLDDDVCYIMNALLDGDVCYIMLRVTCDVSSYVILKIQFGRQLNYQRLHLNNEMLLRLIETLSKNTFYTCLRITELSFERMTVLYLFKY